MVFGVVGNTIRCHSGVYLDLANPQPDQIAIEDIASGLSKICRFGGQIDRFYSVCDHSINAAFLAGLWDYPVDAEFACLMHDAAEAYIGDIVKPLKIMLPDYRSIEQRIERVIGEKFDIDFERHADFVREIDHSLLIAERKTFFSADDIAWCGETEAIPIDQFPLLRHGLDCDQAAKYFLQIFETLTERRSRA